MISIRCERGAGIREAPEIQDDLITTEHLAVLRGAAFLDENFYNRTVKTVRIPYCGLRDGQVVEILAPGTDIMYQMQDGIEYAEYGVLVPANDVEFMSSAISKILFDKDMRRKYIELGPKRAVFFDINKAIADHTDLII